jgi:hypothetical protein
MPAAPAVAAPQMQMPAMPQMGAPQPQAAAFPGFQPPAAPTWPSPAVPPGPGLVLGAAIPQAAIPAPPQPAALAMQGQPISKPSYLPLILILNGLFILAVVIVLIFVLAKH